MHAANAYWTQGVRTAVRTEIAICIYMGYEGECDDGIAGINSLWGKLYPEMNMHNIPTMFGCHIHYSR